MNPDEPQNPTTVPDVNQPAPQPVQSMDFVQPPPETLVPIEQPIQMPPYAPAQPPMPVDNPVVSPVMPTPIATDAQHHKTDVLGILSIVTGVLGLLPVGLVLGLVGASHAKKAQRSVVLSRIGWILNLVFMLAAVPIALLMMDNFQTAQTKARDIERIADINSIHVELEKYFNENFGYPNNLDDLEFSSEQSLIGPKGTTIKVNEVVADVNEAKASTDPSGNVEYTYTPYGKPTCTIACDGYVLKSFIEKPTTLTLNPYVKLGLENL